MKSFRNALACLAAALVLPAAATTHSTDYTDLWYRGEVESGWGVNVIQQYDVIFATFFVYGSDGTPHWYVMPDGRSVASSPGQNQFTGPLYTTTGTWFGQPWVGTTNSQVGTATFNFTSPTSGTLTYGVNGVNVTKQIVRQTWRGNTLAGNYIGGLTANGTGCRNGVPNGPILIFGELTIGHGNFFSPTFQVEFVNAQGQSGTCTYTGGYSQEGKLGRVNSGTFSCTITGVTNPPVGTFTLTQIEANTKGINARFTGADQNCNYDGFFGGIRDVL